MFGGDDLIALLRRRISGRLNCDLRMIITSEPSYRVEDVSGRVEGWWSSADENRSEIAREDVWLVLVILGLLGLLVLRSYKVKKQGHGWRLAQVRSLESRSPVGCRVKDCRSFVENPLRRVWTHWKERKRQFVPVTKRNPVGGPEWTYSSEKDLKRNPVGRLVEDWVSSASQVQWSSGISVVVHLSPCAHLVTLNASTQCNLEWIVGFLAHLLCVIHYACSERSNMGWNHGKG